MIEEVKLKLYSDPQLTQVEAEFIASGTTSPQTIPMSGLDSATRYYAVAYATDDNGVTGQSEPIQFRTLEASVTVEGEVDYTNSYDTLMFITSYTDGENYTLVAQGVEFSTQMDFHSDVQTFVYPSGETGWQNASPFEEHTLYYYRFFAEFEEIGRVYGQPEQNTITTMYAMPVFTIITNDVGENTAEITITYTGNYPIDYNTLRGTVVGGTGDVITLQLDTLTPTHPETITLSGLDASTLYEVEVWMRYYDTYAEAYNSFTTAESTVHNFDFFVSPTYNVDYHIIDFDVTATQIVFDRLTKTNIGLDICAVPDFSGHQLGGELGSGSLTFTWEATGLNEHRRYFCRPWIETLEYGREYGETKIVESHWDIPEITITQSETGWDMVLLDVKYNGGLPVPSNGVIKIYSYDMQTLLQTVNASNLVWNGTRQILVTGLQVHTGYNAVYEGAYYSFGNLVTGSAEIHTASERMTITRTESWAPNGQHTDVITIDIHFGDTIENVSFLYPLGITIVSQTVEDNVYTIVTEGYSYGNPYQFVADVTLGGSYTESRQYNITVPTDNLRVTDTFGHMYPPYIKKGLEGTIYKRTGGRTQFLIDVQNTSLTLVERTTGYECHTACTGVDYQVDTLNNRLKTAMQYYPAGQYRAKWTVTNIMGQTLTEFDMYNSNTTVYGAIFTNVTTTSNSIKFDVRWNMWSGYTQTKRVDLVLNGHVMESLTLTPNVDYNSNIQFTNLFAGMDYVIRAYYDTSSVTNYADYNYTTPIGNLNFTIPNGGTVTLTKYGTPTEVTLEYSLDNGSTWTTWAETDNVRSLTLADGQTMHIRNTSETSTGFSTGSSSTDIYRFSFSANAYAGGNINSLLCKNPQNAVITENCFNRLFLASTLVTAPALPSTEIARGCYNYMFRECRQLESAPEVLPATTTYPYCYYYMFEGCTSLAKAPKILAESITTYACGGMFRNDTALNYIYTVMTQISATTSIGNWVDGVAATGDFYCPAELTIPVGVSGIPSGWTRHNIDGDKYLNFTMPNGGTITLTKNGTPTEVTLEYLIEGEPNWVTWTETDNVRSLTLGAGGKVYIRNTSETSTGFSRNLSNNYKFAFTTDTYAGGNVDSLLCKNPEDAAITAFCFCSLFSGSATLITAPLFPSITVAENCYRTTFLNCTALTLPTNFLLPATILYDGCYREMFRGCVSLILPDTFVLSATTLVQNCYLYMFYGCSSVDKVITNMTDISANNCLLVWLYGVSPNGDFYCPAELTIPTGASGIPSGWTRHDLFG